jgi:hypothetical protein
MRFQVFKGLSRLAAGMMLAMLGFSGAPALAQEKPVKLFGPASPSQAGPAMPAAKAMRGVARQRLVTLNLEALEKGVAPRGLDNAADRLARSPRRSPPIALEMFPGKSGTFRKRDLQEATGGGFIWSGDQAGGGGAATLVVREGRVTGHVELDGSLFKIEPAGGLTHRVTELDPERMRNDGPHLRPQGAAQPTSTSTTQSSPPMAGASTGLTTVDVLVAYTTAARLASSDILADINLAVALTNRAYYNSAVSLRIRLRGTIAVAGYDETRTSYSATLADLTGIADYGSTPAGRLAFAPTRRMRDQVGADLVTLVRVGGGYCGQGWLIEAPTAQTAPYGYSQLSLDCISAFVMAHELAHNMGLRHDRFVEPQAAGSKYNYGFVHVAKRMRDIMSYSNRCTAAGVVCVVKNMFSHPGKLVNGVPFGIPVGKPGATHGARRLNETRLGIAAYRAAKPISTTSTSTATASR